MRVIVLLTFICAIGLNAALAPHWGRPDAHELEVTEVAAPIDGLTIEPAFVDLGEHKPAYQIDCQPELTFTNTCDRPITIHKIEPSCTCTVPKIDLPIIVPAHSVVKQKMAIAMRPKKGQLSVQSTVTFHADAPNGSKGFIRLGLGLTRPTEPRAVPTEVRWGRYAAWEPHVQEFRLDPGAGEDPFVVQDIQVTDPRIQVQIQPKPQGDGLVGTITLPAQSEVSPIRAKAYLKTSHGPLELTITGEGAAHCLPESDIVVCRRGSDGVYRKSIRMRLAPGIDVQDWHVNSDADVSWNVLSANRTDKNEVEVAFQSTQDTQTKASQCILRLGDKGQDGIAQLKCFLLP